MALIDEVNDVLSALASKGWKELFAAHGLTIDDSNLEDSLLTQDLSATIDRKFPGFRDFSNEGVRAIEPGQPAKSLLYHALASPSVQWSDAAGTKPLSAFPTLKQLETVENYIYAARDVSLTALITEHEGENLAVVVVANQYRTAPDTPHGKHADLVFCRTGVARIGNADSEYDLKTRSFKPLSPNKHEIRVLPAKYNAYIAVRKNGSSAVLGRRFNKTVPIDFTNVPPDEELQFWCPIHKLFNGSECLRGNELDLDFNTRHSNEKIGRIHKYISSEFNLDTGSSPPERGEFPFEFETDIAEFDGTTGVLTPVRHDAVVAKAEVDGKPSVLKKGFVLPPPQLRLERRGNSIATFSSSMEFRPVQKLDPISTVGTGAQRSVPEYSHVRTRIRRNGSEDDLNTRADNVAAIATEQYDALHYVDFTGDGFIQVSFSNTAALSRLRNIAAYSIVAPPDYFPYCEQTEIFDSNVPGRVWSRSPQSLADIRLLPNITSHRELLFSDIQAFDTCTALIPSTHDVRSTQADVDSQVEKRVSYLTDAAAGVFAPGWDTSFDMIGVGQVHVPHLAAYGLGSPFPEDAKLCAAISSFWPAVAPDIARSFWPDAENRRTVIPLTDEEIGSDGNPGWDGEHGPQIEERDGTVTVTYKKFAYVDYTLNAFDNKFDYHRLAGIDTEEYLVRVRKFQLAIGQLPTQSRRAPLISYKQIATASGTTHQFRFMLQKREQSNTRDEIKFRVNDELTVRVDENDLTTTS